MKRPASRTERAQPAAPAAEGAARMAALEAERDRLKASLETAEARIADLEKSRAVVVNRIDWLIDKLGSALEKGA